MSNVVVDSLETYRDNLKLVLLFSIPFIIAFLIPLLTPIPTYVSAGGIFLRSASIFVNLNAMSIMVIAVASFFSLLFLSFAFVAINLIVKSKRTYMKTPKAVLAGIERYTSRVFVVLLVYFFLLLVVNIGTYATAYGKLATALFAFFGFMLIFYMPSAIVIDGKKMGRAFKDSVRLVLREPIYFIIWFVLLAAVISLLDIIIIPIAGIFSSYIVLILNSLFVVPYFVIFQAEAYMKRFPLLKH